jgi:enoyl-CoA hydratase/carnithine racemase
VSAAAMALLFAVPISDGGAFECTSSTENIYILTFSSPPDNRITSAFLSAFSLSLNIVEHRYPKGVVVITSGVSKFFSNGFDLEHTSTTPHFMEDSLFPLLRRLLTYPMATIALVNGHVFGAGVFLAMACDYRVQNPSRGFFCLPEVDLGITIPTSIACMLKYKMAPMVYRKAVFEGKRMGGLECLESGLVDDLGGMAEVVKMAAEKNLVKKAEFGALGGLKEDAHSDILTAFDKHQINLDWRDGLEKGKEISAEFARKQVEDWEQKSKL